MIKNKNRNYYLNRTILIIVTMLFGTLLLLLLCADWYLLWQNQSSALMEERDALDGYVEDMEEALKEIDLFLYDIYMNDRDFFALQKAREDELEEYQSAYSLNERFMGKLMIDDNLGGYGLLYHGGDAAMYQVDELKIPARTAKLLRSQMGKYFQEGSRRQWVIQEVDSTIYMMIMFRRGDVAIFGIYDMGQAEEELRERIDRSEVRLMLCDDNRLLQGKELARELDLPSVVQKYHGRFEERRGSYRIMGQRILNTDIWVCAAYGLRFWEFVTPLAGALILLTILSAASAFLLYLFIGKQVFVPLRRLTESMNLLRKEEADDIPELACRFQEIQEMNETLRETIHALKRQKLLTYEEVSEKQKVQLQYLMLQVKPHFYLNSLKTLSALTSENESEKTQELILKLSKYLRYLLNVDRGTIPLYQELEFVQNYLDMQGYLTSQEVSGEIDCEDDAREWEVPMLVIQTFVENSVKYAVGKQPGKVLKIQVRAEVLEMEEENMLNISIQDNGMGYSQEVLCELEQEENRGGFCVGIKNIRRRCRLLYGDKAQFSFFNDGGARSELILPGKST